MAIPMVTRTCLMPVELYREVASYADFHEISWSAAVRILAEKGLNLEDAGSTTPNAYKEKRSSTPIGA